MPTPLSNEIRKKIIQHKENGEKEEDIAKWLLINKSTVTKIWRLYREGKLCKRSLKYCRVN